MAATPPTRHRPTPEGEVLDRGPLAGAGAAGPPVLLLHGWTGSKEDFLPVVDGLAEDRRVLVPDLPGHGSCPPPVDGDYGLAAHVRWVLGLLADLGVDGDLHLLGHSHGGLVAQRIAYAAAHRIASLALVGSGLGALGDDAREQVVAIATTARDHGVEAAWAVAQGQAPVDGAPDPRAAFIRRRFLAMPPEAVLGVGANLVTAAPLGAFLRGIDFPVLVCHGEGDSAWLPHEQRLLARRIAGARYAVVPDALHSPAVENPAAFLALLRPFLADADPAPTRPA
jgi:pimeloyl-ACP methyl ester carboxylesterase